MAEWLETYRGIVNSWETDVVEHFTIAYYFDRFADASRNFFDLIGENETFRGVVGAGPSRLHVTFQNELRAFHAAVVDGAPVRSTFEAGRRDVALLVEAHGLAMRTIEALA